MTSRIGTGAMQSDGAVDFAWCDDAGAVSGHYLSFTSEASLAKHLSRNGVKSYEIVVTRQENGDRDFDVVIAAHVLALKMAVQDAGQDWANAKDDERAAMYALHEAIVAACDAGISEYEATRLAKVHRMTVRAARGKS